MLSFTLLGNGFISKSGVPLQQFRSPKEPALLIYLAHTGQPHSRDFIADLLWDDRSTQQALSNLRTVLTRLRKHVDNQLVITRQFADPRPSEPSGSGFGTLVGAVRHLWAA